MHGSKRLTREIAEQLKACGTLDSLAEFTELDDDAAPVVADAWDLLFLGGYRPLCDGAILCTDCDRDLASNPLGRLLVGTVFCLMSAFTLEFPPRRA